MKYLKAIVFLTLLLMSTITRADLNKDLIAYYSFNDCTTSDNSGNHNNGVLYGTQCVEGVQGNALLFNGVGDYVEIADSASLNPSVLTVSLWIKPTN